MIEKLRQNGKIIINSDIDGIISGLLLSRFCGCTVVGFTNSIDKVWLDVSLCPTLYDGVYVDMFVPNPDVLTIDQHIVGVNSAHCLQISALGNKINPNIENPHSLIPSASYVSKYPFGTCHYIMALLCRDGLDLSAVRLNNKWRGLRFADFLLRADDAMNTTLVNYQHNARAWWRWLSNLSGNADAIERIAGYLYSLGNGRVEEINLQIKSALVNEFGCDRPDGGIVNISSRNGWINDCAKRYMQFVADMGGLPCFGLDLCLSEFRGTNYRISLSDAQQRELVRCNSIDGLPVFSYAFIHKKSNPKCLSYTVMDFDKLF